MSCTAWRFGRIYTGLFRYSGGKASFSRSTELNLRAASRRVFCYFYIKEVFMNKDLDYYMNLEYKMEIFEDEEGFAISFPELPGCITCASTLKEVLENAKDSKETWISFVLENNINIPLPTKP